MLQYVQYPNKKMNDKDETDSCSSGATSGETTDDTSSIVSYESNSHGLEFCIDDENDDDNGVNYNNGVNGENEKKQEQECPRRSTPLHPTSSFSVETLFTSISVTFALVPLMAILAYSFSASSSKAPNTSILATITSYCTSKAPKQVYHWYMQTLEEYPVLTKSLTTAVIQLLGDGVAQLYEQTQKRKRTQKQRGNNNNNNNNRGYDLRRGVSLFVDGLLVGPTLHYCYEFMEEVWPTSGENDNNDHPDDGTITLMARPFATLCHVFINDYIIDSTYIAISFVFTGIVEGYAWREVKEMFWKDYWVTLRASWLTSICLLPVEIYCFGYLSLSLRVLAMNFIDLLWGSIVSFYSHRSRRESPPQKSQPRREGVQLQIQ